MTPESFHNLSKNELETALLIEQGKIDSYLLKVLKPKEYWKAVENKVRIQSELRKKEE